MTDSLLRLGLNLTHDFSRQTIQLDGCGGVIKNPNADLYVANSGTTIRFLCAALAACHGQFTLDGVPRMRQRPIGDLLVALRQLGCDVQSLNNSDPLCPPVRIHATGLNGGVAEIAGNISSQYLSGLMMAAPLARQDVELKVNGTLVSIPYVKMTAAVMRSFGAEVDDRQLHSIRIRSTPYTAAQYEIEPDASAASYFWAAAALTGGAVKVQGLGPSSLQGDVRFVQVLQNMGCVVNYTSEYLEVIGPQQERGEKLRGVEVDMSDISDTVQTLAAVAMFADSPTTVRGVAHNRVKETDRISDLATELIRLGAEIEEFPDGLRIVPPEKVNACEIRTYHDHRMAMSLSLVGLRAAGITILDPDCTSKTYPNYWQDLATLTGCGIERSDRID